MIYNEELLVIIIMYSFKLNFIKYKYYLQLEPQTHSAKWFIERKVKYHNYCICQNIYSPKLF
jgi:hypothetical protein